MAATAKTPDMTVRLALPYEQAREKAMAALKAEGFGVITEIDVQATLKEKLNAQFRKCTILGACNPSLAHQALQTDLEVGLHLPCNVIVYEEGQGSVVMLKDPIGMMEMMGNPKLGPVA
jgi:uncharacterized protein (DUF302 family)